MIAQHDKLYLSPFAIFVLCTFGFILPVFNLYAISRAMPVSRHTIEINIPGFVILTALFNLQDNTNALNAILFIVLAVFFMALGFYGLYGNKRTKAYYKAIKTSIVNDRTLLKPIFSDQIVSVITKALGSIAETVLMLLAILVFLIMFILDKVPR